MDENDSVSLTNAWGKLEGIGGRNLPPNNCVDFRRLDSIISVISGIITNLTSNLSSQGGVSAVFKSCSSSSSSDYVTFVLIARDYTINFVFRRSLFVGSR